MSKEGKGGGEEEFRSDGRGRDEGGPEGAGVYILSGADEGIGLFPSPSLNMKAVSGVGTEELMLSISLSSSSFSNPL